MNNLTDRLPESYEERLALLNIIIKMSVERLGKEATKREILKEPYGRPVPPTPLLTEEELIRRGGFSANPTDDVPIFSYEYGFNPLSYIGDLIKWSHPDSVAARNDMKLKSQQRMEFRAKHAMSQMKTALTLRHTVNTTKSGILWGPFVSPSFTNKTEVVCVLKALREGEVIAQLSRTKNFKDIDIEIIQPVIKADNPIKFVIPNLEEGSHYFIRCCLKDRNYQDPSFPPKPVETEEPEKKLGQNRMSIRGMKESEKKAVEKPVEDENSHLPPHLRPTARFTGVETNSFQSGEFWTIMAEDAGESDEEDSLGDDEESYGEDDVNGLYVEPLLLMAVGISSVHHKQKAATVKNAAEASAGHISNPGSLSVNAISAGDSAVNSPVASPVASTSKLLNRGSTRENRRSQIGAPLVVSKVPLTSPDARYLISDSPLALSNEFTPRLTDSILYSLCANGDEEEAKRKKIPNTPMYSCLIGDIFNSAIVAAEETSSLGIYGTLMDSLFKLSIQNGVFCNTLSIFRKTAFMLGWNDGSVGAKSGLRAEEVLYKHFSHDLRRHQRKYKLDKKGNPLNGKEGGSSQAAIPPAPVLMRPPVSSTLETLLNNFGLQLRDDPSASARLMYRRMMLGPICEVIVLDSRNGYLGQEQAKWLTATLESSMSPWKIIISGCAVGMRAAVPFTEEEVVGKITDTMNVIDERRNSMEGFVEDIPEPEEEEPVEEAPPEYDFLGRLITTPVVSSSVQGRIDKQSEKDARKAAKHAEKLKDLEKYNLVAILRNLNLSIDANSVHKMNAEEEETENVEGEDAEEGVADGQSAGGAGDMDGVPIDSEMHDIYDGALPDELHDPSLRVSSGIILLTSGLDVPYVAAYDLKKEGKLNGPTGGGQGYLVEVGVGSMTITTEQEKLAEGVITKPPADSNGIPPVPSAPNSTAVPTAAPNTALGVSTSVNSLGGNFSTNNSAQNIIPVQSAGVMPSMPGTAEAAAVNTLSIDTNDSDVVRVNSDIPYGIQVADGMLDVDVKLMHGTFMNDFHYYPENTPITYYTAMGTTETELVEKAKSLGSLRSRNSSILSSTLLEDISLIKDSDGGAPETVAAASANANTNANAAAVEAGGDSEATEADFVPLNILQPPEINETLAKQMLTTSMVNTTPPCNAYTGPASCGLYVHSNGTITVSINNLKTNEPIATVDMTSMAVLPSSEPASP